MGNKDSGSLTVGDTKAINVLTMFEKLARVVKDIACDGKTKEEIEKLMQGEDILTTVYADVCNFGHPNFNANLSIGLQDKNNVWRGKQDSDGYKKELVAFYLPGLVIGISTIVMLCGLITRNEKVNAYNLLQNELYFS